MAIKNIELIIRDQFPQVELKVLRFLSGELDLFWVGARDFFVIAQHLKEKLPQLQLKMMNGVDFDQSIWVTLFISAVDSAQNHTLFGLRSSFLFRQAQAPVFCPSFTSLWSNAAFFEEEISAQFGVGFLKNLEAEGEFQFLNTPWEGFPMRKSFRYNNSETWS